MFVTFVAGAQNIYGALAARTKVRTKIIIIMKKNYTTSPQKIQNPHGKNGHESEEAESLPYARSTGGRLVGGEGTVAAAEPHNAQRGAPRSSPARRDAENDCTSSRPPRRRPSIHTHPIDAPPPAPARWGPTPPLQQKGPT